MKDLLIISKYRKQKEKFKNNGFIVLALFAVGILNIVLSDNDKTAVYSVPLIFIGVFILIFSIQKYLKCPNCNKLPKGGDGKVILNPKTCPNCGVVLSGDALDVEKVNKNDMTLGRQTMVFILIPFIISGYLFIKNYQIYFDGEIVYGEVSNVYYRNKNKSFDIKWIDSKTGHVKTRRLKSQNSFFWAANKGEVDEFILYKNAIYPSHWTEFFVLPLIVLLMGLGSLFRSRKK
jgi:uncharacterized C2H2 Zn-finger protein